MSRIALILATSLALAAGAALAHDFTAGTLGIDHPFARATPPGAKAAGAFMKIRNTGKDADRLVRAASPVAGVVEIHEMVMEGSVMKMRAVPGIEIKPGATVALQPGGYHVMLLELKRPLVKGETFPVTLTFDKAGATEVVVTVEAMGATGHSPH